MEVSVTNFHQYIIDIENLFVQYISNGKPPDIFSEYIGKIYCLEDQIKNANWIDSELLNPVIDGLYRHYNFIICNTFRKQLTAFIYKQNILVNQISSRKIYSENWEANRQQRERTINERTSSPKCILQTS